MAERMDIVPYENIICVNYLHQDPGRLKISPVNLKEERELSYSKGPLGSMYFVVSVFLL